MLKNFNKTKQQNKDNLNYPLDESQYYQVEYMSNQNPEKQKNPKNKQILPNINQNKNSNNKQSNIILPTYSPQNQNNFVLNLDNEPYGNQSHKQKQEQSISKIIQAQLMPENIYQYSEPIARKNSQNNEDTINNENNDNVIQGLPMRNAYIENRNLQEMMQDGDIINNQNNDVEFAQPRIQIAMQQNQDHLVFHYLNNDLQQRNIDIQKIYANDGYSKKVRGQFQFYSVVRFIDQIALKLIQDFPYKIIGLNLMGNLNLKSNVENQLIDMILKQIKQSNNIQSNEMNLILMNSQYMQTLKLQMHRIQDHESIPCHRTLFIIIYFGSFLYKIQYYSSIDDSEDTGKQIILAILILQCIHLLILMYVFLQVYLAVRLTRYANLLKAKTISFIAFILTLPIFLLSLDAPGEGKSTFIIISLVEFLLFICYDLQQTFSVMNLRYQLIKLLVLTKEVPIEELKK